MSMNLWLFAFFLLYRERIQGNHPENFVIASAAPFDFAQGHPVAERSRGMLRRPHE